MDKDTILFDDKSLSDVLSDIYINNKNKSSQIDAFLNTLSQLIENVNDAALVVPLIREYLEISVKNDDQLVKLAIIMQKLVTNIAITPTNFGLTDDEKQQLLDVVKHETKQLEEKSKQDDQISQLEKKTESVIQQIKEKTNGS